MKLAKEIGSGVLVSGLFLALATVLPIGAAIAVAVPFVGLLVLAQVADSRGCKQCASPIDRSLRPRSAWCSEPCYSRHRYLQRPAGLTLDPSLGETWYVGPSRRGGGWWGAECFVCGLMTYDHDDQETAIRSLLAHLQSEHERDKVNA